VDGGRMGPGAVRVTCAIKTANQLDCHV